MSFIPSSDKEFLFTEANFRYLTQLVHAKSGISLKEDKRELVYGRLARRLRYLGLESFDEYCSVLKSNDEVEIVNCINAITTNVTHFFREIHHFEFIEKTLIPEMQEMKKTLSRPKVRIWSAGCSSGNEPYSIAIVLKDNLPNISDWDVKILATDLDSNPL